MTPADRRISELIDKWLASVDLHLQYVELSDAAYSRAQPWPKHDRPSRWVLEVARQKILELKQHCETRQAMGDSRFAEALELMSFLANLVGIQNIQRFIPHAEQGKDGTGTLSGTSTNPTMEAPTVIKPAITRARPVTRDELPGTPARRSATDESTREMPRLRPAVAAKPAVPVPAPKPASKPAPSQAVRPAAQRTTGAKAEPPSAALPADMKGKIITDAIRLLKWGKPWHELAELIGRIAERPPVPEIRKVLRTHKAEIESKVAG